MAVPGRLRHRRVAMFLVAVGPAYVLATFVQVAWGTQLDQRKSAEAIVVLGAAQYDGRPSPVLRARLDHALELHQADVAPLIVLTGGSQEGDRASEAFAGFEYLRGRGVPEDQLLLEVDGTSTWESLAAAERILSQRQIDEVVLVSDPYHTIRSLAIAEEVGLSAQASPSDVGSSFSQLMRETAAVSLGRLVGYRRLVRLEDVAEN